MLFRNYFRNHYTTNNNFNNCKMSDYFLDVSMKIMKDNDLEFSPLGDKKLISKTTKYFSSIKNIFDYFPPCIQGVKSNFISPSGRQLGLRNSQTIQRT